VAVNYTGTVSFSYMIHLTHSLSIPYVSALFHDTVNFLDKNMMLREIFGPKREEVTEDWRKLQNKGLHNLYPSPNIIQVIESRMRWVRHVTHMGEKRNPYRILVGKHEQKRLLGRPMHRLEDNINTFCYPTVLARIYVIGFLSQSDS
jgi:hypothetical protein